MGLINRLGGLLCLLMDMSVVLMDMSDIVLKLLIAGIVQR